jgi:hypothetical protein
MNGINRSQGEGETRCANTYCGLQEEDCNHPTPLQFYGGVSFIPTCFGILSLAQWLPAVLKISFLKIVW